MSVSSRPRRARPLKGARNGTGEGTRRGVLRPVRRVAAGALRGLGLASSVLGRMVERLGPIRVAAVLLAAAVLGATWLWFRDSSLVTIRQVEITGAAGPDSGRIRAALIAAAHTMTTLDLQRSRLHTAVAPYPAVKGLQIATDFPNGLRIHVIEELPGAILTAGGRRVPVSADGAVLREARTTARLPVLPAPALPVGPRVTDQQNQQELAVLAAAPAKLAARAARVVDTGAHGIVVKLRAGPSLYFGTASSLHAKWIAATAVLASPGSAGAVYIDLTDPSRPAAG